MIRITLISPSGMALQSFQSIQRTMAASDSRQTEPPLVTVITWKQGIVFAGGTIVRVDQNEGPIARWAGQKFAGSVIGRNLLRMTPLDGGRRLARAVRNNSQAREALADCDIIIAAERDAILTTWRAARVSRKKVFAAYGVPAGLAKVYQ
jgi:hypothetical protein